MASTPLRSLKSGGTYLGYVIVVTRGIVKFFHSPGGSMENLPPDWQMAFEYALAYAASYMTTEDGNGTDDEG